MGNTIRLAGNKVRIFEVIAVILAVVTLIDELRAAGIILEDRSNGPSPQKLPRQRVSVLIQLGNVVDDGDRQVITLFGQPVCPYLLEGILGLIALLVGAAALIIPVAKRGHTPCSGGDRAIADVESEAESPHKLRLHDYRARASGQIEDRDDSPEHFRLGPVADRH